MVQAGQKHMQEKQIQNLAHQILDGTLNHDEEKQSNHEHLMRL